MKKIELVEIRQVNDALAEMVALFRVELRSYKGIASKPNVEDGREEMKEYLLAGFPVFAATVHGEYAGYVVCRIESEVVWVESIFVREEYRRQGVAVPAETQKRNKAARQKDKKRGRKNEKESSSDFHGIHYGMLHGCMRKQRRKFRFRKDRF